MGGQSHTAGPWERLEGVVEVGHPIYKPGTVVTRIVQKRAPDQSAFVNVALVDTGPANARLIAAAPELLEALADLQDVFAHDGEGSLERFERLAEMFRKDTGYLAPGKDPGVCSSQPDGEELRAIYDAWFFAKVTRARAAIQKATGESAA